MHWVACDAILLALASWKPFLRVLASYEKTWFLANKSQFLYECEQSYIIKQIKKPKPCLVLWQSTHGSDESTREVGTSTLLQLVFFLHFFRALVTSLHALSQNKAWFWLFYLLNNVDFIYVWVSQFCEVKTVLCFRYQILAPTAVSGGFVDGKKACEMLLDAIQLEKASYRVGTSKVITILWPTIEDKNNGNT